ncbi:MAG: pyroglutamyl-peptidase I [Planctomycetaceae bacterium]|nr:pyroglutamyl-peptidase I [Planctomycetaceae bacterium]
MLLISGFEPFDGADINPSASVVEALENDPPPGIDLATTILPVETGVAAEHLLSMIDQCGADIVVMLGEARGRPSICIEQVALNLLDFSIPDNAGQQIQERKISPDGPDAIFATLPVRRLVDGLCMQDIPTERSLSAGTYLCNEISYRILEQSRKQDGSPSPIAGFIHLPSLPSQSAVFEGKIPSMSLDLQIQAVRSIIEILKQSDSDDGSQVS